MPKELLDNHFDTKSRRAADTEVECCQERRTIVNEFRKEGVTDEEWQKLQGSVFGTDRAYAAVTRATSSHLLSVPEDNA
jgi:hypothetical protein